MQTPPQQTLNVCWDAYDANAPNIFHVRDVVIEMRSKAQHGSILVHLD